MPLCRRRSARWQVAWLGAAVLVSSGGCVLFTNLDDFAGGDAADATSEADSTATLDALSADVGDLDASPYAAAVLTDTPLAYWRLGDPAGTLNPSDRSGHGHALTVVGGVELGAEGALAADVDTAVHLTTGVLRGDDRLNLAGNVAMSVEAWVLVDRADGAIKPVIAAKETGDGAGWAFYFWDDGPGNTTVRFDRQQSWQTRTYCLAYFSTVGAAAFDGKYHHLVATYDTVTTRLYVDGAEKQNCVTASLAMPETDGGIELGRTLEGRLDEIAIYDHALPLPNVRAHYQAGARR